MTRLESTDTVEDTVESDEHADLPDVRGFEQCAAADGDWAQSELRERFDPREVDPRAISSVEYSPERPVDDKTGERILGSAAKYEYDGTGEYAHTRITIYDHSDVAKGDADFERHLMKGTLAHEVGHSVWWRASDDARQRYKDNVEGTPDTTLTPPPSRYAREGDEGDHFAETYSTAMTRPREISRLDSHRDARSSLENGFRDVRNDALGVDR